MKSKVHFKFFTGLLSLLVIAPCVPTFAQTFVFNWSTDGYSDCSGGGTYNNIDGTGVNMTVTGLNRDCISFAVCGCINSTSGCVQTTADNSIPAGTVYNYTFTFSQAVNVHFKMDELDKANGGSGHYDEVTMSGSPTFSNLSGVSVSGSTIFPGNSSSSSLETDYSCITTFNIQHGSGLSSTNPPAILHIFDLSLETCGPFPVEMEAFEVSAKDDDVEVFWRTTMESQIDAFVVEKMDINGIWEERAFLASEGKENEGHTYKWLDFNPGHGRHDYRIRVDHSDGEQIYWPVRSVQISEGKKTEMQHLFVHPNPSQGTFFVDFDGLPIQEVQLYNTIGQQVPTSIVAHSAGRVRVEVENIPPGMYIIVAKGQGMRRTAKITLH